VFFRWVNPLQREHRCSLCCMNQVTLYSMLSTLMLTLILYCSCGLAHSIGESTICQSTGLARAAPGSIIYARECSQ
jgi:hypothetical protein